MTKTRRVHTPGTLEYARRILNPTGFCMLCGEFCFALATHLKYSHDGLDIHEYYKRYPHRERLDKKAGLMLSGR